MSRELPKSARPDADLEKNFAPIRCGEGGGGGGIPRAAGISSERFDSARSIAQRMTLEGPRRSRGNARNRIRVSGFQPPLKL